MPWSLIPVISMLLWTGCSGVEREPDDSDTATDSAADTDSESDTDSAADTDSESDTASPTFGFIEDFGGLQGDYQTGDAFGRWGVVAATETVRVAAATSEGISAASGTNVLRFLSPSDSFSANRIDRCTSIDPSRLTLMSYKVLVAGAAPTDDLRVRVNANFYADRTLCEQEVASGVNDSRLEGELTNEDFDVRLGSVAIAEDSWFHVTEASHGRVGPLQYEANTLPSNAIVMRFSLRVRDDAFAPGRAVFIDDVRVTQP